MDPFFDKYNNFLFDQLFIVKHRRNNLAITESILSYTAISICNYKYGCRKGNYIKRTSAKNDY